MSAALVETVVGFTKDYGSLVGRGPDPRHARMSEGSRAQRGGVQGAERQDIQRRTQQQCTQGLEDGSVRPVCALSIIRDERGASAYGYAVVAGVLAVLAAPALSGLGDATTKSISGAARAKSALPLVTGGLAAAITNDRAGYEGGAPAPVPTQQPDPWQGRDAPPTTTPNDRPPTGDPQPSNDLLRDWVERTYKDLSGLNPTSLARSLALPHSQTLDKYLREPQWQPILSGNRLPSLGDSTAMAIEDVQEGNVLGMQDLLMQMLLRPELGKSPDNLFEARELVDEYDALFRDAGVFTPQPDEQLQWYAAWDSGPPVLQEAARIVLEQEPSFDDKSPSGLWNFLGENLSLARDRLSFFTKETIEFAFDNHKDGTERSMSLLGFVYQLGRAAFGAARGLPLTGGAHFVLHPSDAWIALREQKLPFTRSPLAVKGGGDKHAYSANDVFQGRFGDCYYLAALGAIAEEKPEFLEESITKLGGGRYKVRFFKQDSTGQYKPTYVTVGPHFKSAHARTGDSGEVWVMAFEEAYKEFKGSYDAVEGDEGGHPVEAFRDLAGFAVDVAPRDYPGLDSYYATLLRIHRAGTPMVAASSTREALKSDLKRAGIQSKHAYTVVEMDEDTVTLQNPWGYNFGTFTGDVTITKEQYLTLMMHTSFVGGI